MSTAPTSNVRDRSAFAEPSVYGIDPYGMIVIQPTAPMPVYGVMSQRAHGHAVTTVLIAMVAMLFTAIAYGRMARAYPSAGSAFTYVGFGNRSRAWLCHRMEHGHGLHAEPDRVYDSLQQVRAQFFP